MENADTKKTNEWKNPVLLQAFAVKIKYAYCFHHKAHEDKKNLTEIARHMGISKTRPKIKQFFN